MRSGDTLLRDLDARLKLPARVRSEVLREVRDDLRDMVTDLVGQGVSLEEAEERAVRLLHPGDDAVQGLAAVHRSPYERLSARVGREAVRGMENTTLLAMAILAAAAPAPALLQAGRMPVWAALPLLVLAGLMAANLTRETLRWWVRQEQDVGALVHAAVVQGAAVGLAVVWGGLATATDAYLATAAWEVAAPSSPSLAAGISRLTTLMALSLGVAMLGVFGSLALMQALWHARNLEGELAELLHSSDSNR